MSFEKGVFKISFFYFSKALQNGALACFPRAKIYSFGMILSLPKTFK